MDYNKIAIIHLNQIGDLVFSLPLLKALRDNYEEDAEKRAILKALADNDQKINQAAVSLGISRKNLWEKMKRYDISK